MRQTTYTVIRSRTHKYTSSGAEIPEEYWNDADRTIKVSRGFESLDDARRERDAWNDTGKWHAWVIRAAALGGYPAGTPTRLTDSERLSLGMPPMSLF